MNCVASSLPGRIRLRHAALRNPDRLARLQRTIADWPQVRAASFNDGADCLLGSRTPPQRKVRTVLVGDQKKRG